MRRLNLILVLLVFVANTDAQKVEFKKGMITVDGKDYAKVDVKKQNFGLTRTFEVFTLAGKKIIIAAPATEFESDKSDNTKMYYRLTFLTSNQIGIFKIASLSQEKSFTTLIGQSGIIVNDSTDDTKVKEFIALKGASPSIAINYTVVPRDRFWPVRLQDDKNFEQNSKIIGSFKHISSVNEIEYYEYYLPSGVLIAKASFTGGNNAQNCEIFTPKDNLKRIVPIAPKNKIIAGSGGIDKYQFTVERIGKWLVENQYM